MAELQIPHESDILARVIAPQNGNLPGEIAEAFLRLSFPDQDIDRMNELAEKNRKGEATEEERNELERYSRVGNFLNLLQSKARRSLKHG